MIKNLRSNNSGAHSIPSKQNGHFFKRAAEIEGQDAWGAYRHFDWFAEEYLKHMPGDWEANQKLTAYIEELYKKSSSS